MCIPISGRIPLYSYSLLSPIGLCMSNERYESTLTQEEDLGKAWKRAFVKELAEIEKFFALHERAPRIVGFSEEHRAWIIKTNKKRAQMPVCV